MQMIEIEALNKTYRTGFLMQAKKALTDVSLSVPKGSIYGFIGPNGAGKSTTIKILTGLLTYDSGRVEISGASARGIETRRLVGYSPEHPYFYDYLTARELMVFYGHLVGLSGLELQKRIDWALELVHANKDWADRRLRTYSKGMVQRIGIAQAILSKPKLLILDEPMSGLDPMGRRDVRNAILSLNQEGVTVFYSSHLLSDVESISDRVGMIVDGRVVREGKIHSITDSHSAEYHVFIQGPELQEAPIRGVKKGVQSGEWLCKSSQVKDEFLRFCVDNNLSIQKIDIHRPSLEDVLTEEIARAES